MKNKTNLTSGTFCSNQTVIMLETKLSPQQSKKLSIKIDEAMRKIKLK